MTNASDTLRNTAIIAAIAVISRLTVEGERPSNPAIDLAEDFVFFFNATARHFQPTDGLPRSR